MDHGFCRWCHWPMPQHVIDRGDKYCSGACESSHWQEQGIPWHYNYELGRYERTSIEEARELV